MYLRNGLLVALVDSLIAKTRDWEGECKKVFLYDEVRIWIINKHAYFNKVVTAPTRVYLGIKEVVVAVMGWFGCKFPISPLEIPVLLMFSHFL